MFEGKKILDFYIRKKNYQKHIQKLKEISNKKSRDIFDDSMKQTFNQFKLKNKKFAFQERNREILEYNSKVFEKLVDISGRIPQHLVDLKDYRKKNHHNSYFIQKNQQKTINEQNSHIVKRILNQNSPLSKKQQQTFYQQTRKFKQRIQKFPYFSSIDRKLKSLVRRSSPEYTPRKKNERYNTQNFSINEDTFDD